MPVSETTNPLPQIAAYVDALEAFRKSNDIAVADVVRTYHAVRAMPYGSGPDRTPLTALRSGRGACTAKHLILRDLLRSVGITAVIELVDGDFASGLVAAADAMPRDLAAMVRKGGVRDIHCRVRIGTGAGVQLLDATWPDGLGTVGVTVNDGWDGIGDTIGAIPHVRVRSEAEDVLAEKARLLAELSLEETERRRRFLRLLSDWLG